MIDKENIVGYSYLGTPYYSDIIFQKGSYINSKGQKISYEEIKLYDIIMNVSQTKNIIETPVQGGRNFIEYISDGNWDVTISGRLSPSDKETMFLYPDDVMNLFVELCKAQDSIAVVSKYLQRFSIYNLVIMSIDAPQTEGSHSIQAFTLTCKSDEPIELILK